MKSKPYFYMQNWYLNNDIYNKFVNYTSQSEINIQGSSQFGPHW